MEPQFWRDRWQEGKIGFHEGKPNSFLAQHEARLAGERVLVPLCGKTEDLAYLAAQGHTVIGIELVEDAVRAFFAEHGLEPMISGNRYTAKGITLIASDLFAVSDVGTIDAIYDRAALIALPPELRPKYVDKVRALAGAGTPGLLITLEYPQERMSGPPFSVLEAEVRTLYPRVERIDERLATGGRAGELGVAMERCYAVTL